MNETLPSKKAKYLKEFLLQIKNWYKQKTSDHYVQKHRTTFIWNLGAHEGLIISKFQWIGTVGCIKENESQNRK